MFLFAATKADEPVPDPLGLKQVDLRVYQKTLVEGDTSAVVVSHTLVYFVRGVTRSGRWFVVYGWRGQLFQPFTLAPIRVLPFCQEVDGTDREMSGTLQAKKRALLGQKDRLRLLKKVQSGKERVQRKMERGRSSKGEGVRGGEIGSIPESKPVSTETRYVGPRRFCSLIPFRNFPLVSTAAPVSTICNIACTPPDAILPCCAQFSRNGTPLRSRSVVPTMEDFDPALFMTVLHSAASFNDIRNGLESLDGAKANQVRAFLSYAFAKSFPNKSNVDSFEGGFISLCDLLMFDIRVMSMILRLLRPQASELQHLVRDHFDSFVRCADSIEKYASHINMELSKNKEQVANARIVLFSIGVHLPAAGTLPRALALFSLRSVSFRYPDQRNYYGKVFETWSSSYSVAYHLRV